MSDLDFEEQAQLGLKYIEDAVVNLLTRHRDGLAASDIAASLGLGAELDAIQRERLIGAIMELLAASGRILRDSDGRVFKDNPSRS
jgi:hypothetical protein